MCLRVRIIPSGFFFSAGCFQYPTLRSPDSGFRGRHDLTAAFWNVNEVWLDQRVCLCVHVDHNSNSNNNNNNNSSSSKNRNKNPATQLHSGFHHWKITINMIISSFPSPLLFRVWKKKERNVGVKYKQAPLICIAHLHIGAKRSELGRRRRRRRARHLSARAEVGRAPYRFPLETLERIFNY